jgi:Fe-Mn family superoxide dismutase
MDIIGLIRFSRGRGRRNQSASLSKEDAMTFALPALPYPETALQPHISAETLQFHHGKHHLAYINKTNELVAGKDYPDDLTGVVLKAHARGDHKLFNQAAQAWNHDFYWRSMRPAGGGAPRGTIAELINRDCGGYDKFRSTFVDTALGQFGSGWAWLALDGRKLAVLPSHDAGTPLVLGMTPLAVIDVWEHAYYIDHRNNRKQHVEAFLDHLIDWDFANANIVAARAVA